MNNIGFKYHQNVLVCITCAILLLCTAMTCDEPWAEKDYSKIHIINKSGEVVYVHYAGQGCDILIKPSNTISLGLDKLNKIAPNDTCVYEIINPDKSNFPNEYHQFIVFRQSTIDENGIDKLAENDIYDKLYIYNYSELSGLDFKIFFPEE